MKLSFSISSKASSSRPLTSKTPNSFNLSGDLNHKDGLQDEPKPYLVTVFDQSENPFSYPTSQRVNTLNPNPDLRSNMKMKNLPLPTADELSTKSRFVLDTSGNNSSKTSQYGLMLRSNCTEAKSQETTMRRFHEPAKDLPDLELPDLPVEGIGAALLAPYGWVEGKPIGRNSKEDPKVCEFKRRAGREGFVNPPNVVNSGKKNQKEEIAAGFKSFDEKGDHTDTRVEWKIENRVSRKTGMDRSEDRSNHEKRRKYDVSTIATKSPVRWLRNHIRVRIISKKFGGGKFYLKKGEVVDVVGPTICDIKMDETGILVQGVDQEILETALPKRGGSVLVLYGKNKGVYGSLIERDSEKETCVVSDADSHALINVMLEQVAEYIGDPCYLGY